MMQIQYIEFDYCSLVVIHITVVWRTEDCDYHREFLSTSPTMHFVTFQLSLMCSNDRNKVIPFEESQHCLLPIKI